MTVRVEPMLLSSLVDLVNGWGTTPRAEAGEQDDPFPALATVSGRLGVPGVSPTDGALARVADRLHPVFGTSDPHERARLVTELLDTTAVRPGLRSDEHTLRAGWIVPRIGQAVLAAAAVALRAHLAEHGAGRLGVCSGRRCADVYVDASPAGRRRFCSVTCQNRARVAAYRSRHADQYAREF